MTPTEKHYYLLADDSCFWQIAVVSEDAKAPGESNVTPNGSYPLETRLPNEIEGPFTANLMLRAPAFLYRQYSQSSWTGWSISKAEYDQILKLAELAPTAREFNRLKAYREIAPS